LPSGAKRDARALWAAGRAVRAEKRVIRNSHEARNTEATARKQKLALISEGWRWFDMFALAGSGSAGRFSSSPANPLKRGLLLSERCLNDNSIKGEPG